MLCIYYIHSEMCFGGFSPLTEASMASALPEWQGFKSKTGKTPNLTEIVEELELSSIGGENVKLYHHCGKLSVSLKNKYTLP
jgi:hypothetical protein